MSSRAKSRDPVEKSKGTFTGFLDFARNDKRRLDKTRSRRRLGRERKIFMNNEHQSTYSLLVRSEEKGRSVIETLVYALLALSVAVSIVQFAHEHNQMPASVMGEPAEIQYLSHQTGPDCDGRC